MAKGQDIVDEVRAQLNDEDSGAYRWSDAEMLRYVNAGQRQIVFELPEANIVEEPFQITSDDPRQELPTGGVKFLKAFNYDNDNSARGAPLISVELDSLNSGWPAWPTSGMASFPTDGYEHVAHDPRNPTVFYVFPGGEGYILLSHCKLPTELEDLDDDFGLGDEYINAAVTYVNYRCLTKDGRHGTGPSQRQELYNEFLRALGKRPVSLDRVDPGAHRPPGDQHG